MFLLRISGRSWSARLHKWRIAGWAGAFDKISSIERSSPFPKPPVLMGRARASFFFSAFTTAALIGWDAQVVCAGSCCRGSCVKVTKICGSAAHSGQEFVSSIAQMEDCGVGRRVQQCQFERSSPFPKPPVLMGRRELIYNLFFTGTRRVFVMVCVGSCWLVMVHAGSCWVVLIHAGPC